MIFASDDDDVRRVHYLLFSVYRRSECVLGRLCLAGSQERSRI